MKLDDISVKLKQKAMESNGKFRTQEAQYEFPYHYIPHFEKDGTPSLSRKLSWGFDYLCYQQHLHEKVVAMKPHSVLEVGCGDGFFIGYLPEKIPSRVGVDLSSKAIAFAKAFNPHCSFYDYDASKLEEKFDVVAAIEVIEHIPDDKLAVFFQTLCDRVNDGGTLIISVPTVVQPLNKKHYRHYNIELFEEEIKQSGVNLKIDKVEYVFSKPGWLGLFRRIFDNRFFSLEIKSVTRVAWKQIWKKHRIVNRSNGCHLVVELSKN